MRFKAILAAASVVAMGGAAQADDGPCSEWREAGVIGDLLECAGVWCRLEIAGDRGWLPRVQLWGVYPDEVVD